MRYPKLYTGTDGESYFEDIEIDLALTDYAPPAPPLELSSFTPATSWLHKHVFHLGEWHPAPSRSIFFVLTGEWEVTASDGESRRFPAGSELLLEDTTGTGHSSRVVGETESLAAMVQLD